MAKGRFAAVERKVSEGNARRVIDASGMLVPMKVARDWSSTL